MEYNELITKAQQASVDVPDTDAILAGMHRTLRRRRQHWQAVLSMVIVFAIGTAAYFLQPRYETRLTLAECVSAHIDTPPTRTPAPLVGYRHSMYNRQIYTLL
jgi:hypothetical protein